MKKKDYQKPTMKVVKLQHQCHILTTSSYETKGDDRIIEMEDEEDL